MPAMTRRRATSPSAPASRPIKWDVCDFDACMAGVAAGRERARPGRRPRQQCRHHPRRNDEADDAARSWDEVIDVNLGGCFNMAKAVFDGMQARKFGRIVNIGSINGQAGQYGQVNYAAAKSGHPRLHQGARPGRRPRRRHRERDRARLYRHRDGRGGAARTCSRRSSPGSRSDGSARPRRSPAASLFLCGEDGGFITGSTLSINGGQHMY